MRLISTILLTTMIILSNTFIKGMYKDKDEELNKINIAIQNVKDEESFLQAVETISETSKNLKLPFKELVVYPQKLFKTYPEIAKKAFENSAKPALNDPNTTPDDFLQTFILFAVTKFTDGIKFIIEEKKYSDIDSIFDAIQYMLAYTDLSPEEAMKLFFENRPDLLSRNNYTYIYSQIYAKDKKKLIKTIEKTYFKQCNPLHIFVLSTWFEPESLSSDHLDNNQLKKIEEMTRLVTKELLKKHPNTLTEQVDVSVTEKDMGKDDEKPISTSYTTLTDLLEMSIKALDKHPNAIALLNTLKNALPEDQESLLLNHLATSLQNIAS